MRERCALLSVYDKSGIGEFARALAGDGWRIYASGGTARTLAAAGIATTDVADLVGGGAILGHRVVTLSREIHAALLARPVDEDLAELDTLGVPFIDLVCVDLYPLADEIAKPDATPESVIEKTDIGGPTMLRSAAKGRRIVVSLPQQRAAVLAWLADGEPDPAAFRDALAAQAEAVIADYCLASARYHSHGRFDGVVAEATRVLKYGENAPQAPAHLLKVAAADPLALDNLTLLAGTEPSYNNLAEVARQIQTVSHIAAGFARNFGAVPCIALGTKHGNACGAAVGESPVAAVRTMVMGDPRAIFGGLVMLNFAVTEEVAAELLTYGVSEGRRVLDAVTAPSFEPAAVQLLSRKGDKCRFLENEALGALGEASLDATPMLRQVRGGFLRQPNYTWRGRPRRTRGQPHRRALRRAAPRRRAGLGHLRDLQLQHRHPVPRRRPDRQRRRPAGSRGLLRARPQTRRRRRPRGRRSGRRERQLLPALRRARDADRRRGRGHLGDLGLGARPRHARALPRPRRGPLAGARLDRPGLLRALTVPAGRRAGSRPRPPQAHCHPWSSGALPPWSPRPARVTVLRRGARRRHAGPSGDDGIERRPRRMAPSTG